MACSDGCSSPSPSLSSMGWRANGAYAWCLGSILGEYVAYTYGDVVGWLVGWRCRWCLVCCTSSHFAHTFTFHIHLARFFQIFLTLFESLCFFVFLFLFSFYIFSLQLLTASAPASASASGVIYADAKKSARSGEKTCLPTACLPALHCLLICLARCPMPGARCLVPAAWSLRPQCCSVRFRTGQDRETWTRGAEKSAATCFAFSRFLLQCPGKNC